MRWMLLMVAAVSIAVQGCAAMPGARAAEEEANKAAIRSFVEGLERGDIAAVDAFVADDFVERTPEPGQDTSKAGFRTAMEQWLGSAEFKAQWEHLVAEGDIAVAHHMTRSAFKEDFMGLPTKGKTVNVREIHIGRFRDGKMVEHWGLMDLPGMMAQLGIAPPEASGK